MSSDPLNVFCQENILVNSSGRACLADPGLFATTDSMIAHWTSQSSVVSKVGPARWQAPELNDAENDIIHDTTESDIYAWSCVCYEVCVYLHLQTQR